MLFQKRVVVALEADIDLWFESRVGGNKFTHLTKSHVFFSGHSSFRSLGSHSKAVAECLSQSGEAQ